MNGYEQFPWAQLACVLFCVLFAGWFHHWFKKWFVRRLYLARVRRTVKAQQRLWYSGRV